MRKRGLNHRQKILIVDDHPIVRYGLTQLISRERNLSVCGEAEDVAGAMDAIAKARPDLVLVDITLQGARSGIELTKQIKAKYTDLPVLVVSMHDERLYAEHVLLAGARGYIMKKEPTGRLVAAIRKVLAGGIYLSDEIKTEMVETLYTRRPGRDKSPATVLSEREIEVFHLIGSGMGMRQIAKQLHLSIKTVETHRERIKEKLNLRSSVELQLLASHSPNSFLSESAEPVA